jgi:hypothetical protein
MRLTAFFGGAIAILSLLSTKVAAIEWSSPLATTVYPPTLSLTPGDSTIRNGATVEPTLLIAQESRTQRIRFAPGGDRSIVKGSVVRGTRDIYLLRAFGNQTMTVNITSLEKNAIFDIQAPNGKFLSQESASWSGILPTTGDYSVIVGGTRGNATYQLEVIIR